MLRPILLLALTGPALGLAKVQKVIISAPYAIVYADPTFRSPIGKISKGRAITMGSPKSHLPNAPAPVIVSGKVAYIQARDTTPYDQTQKGPPRPPPLEHNVDIIHEKKPISPKEHAHFELSGGNSTFSEWRPLLNDFYSSPGDYYETDLLLSGQLFFHYRPPGPHWGWGLGLSYTQSPPSIENIKFSLTALEFCASYTLWNAFNFLSLEAFGGGLVSGAFLVTSKTAKQHEEDAKSVYGVQGGARARLFPHSKLGAFVGGQYFFSKVDGKREIVLPSDGPLEESKRVLLHVEGWRFFGGLSYKL